jgi:hypothetical protein
MTDLDDKWVIYAGQEILKFQYQEIINLTNYQNFKNMVVGY